MQECPPKCSNRGPSDFARGCKSSAPAYKGPKAVVDISHQATQELRHSESAERSLKTGDHAGCSRSTSRMNSLQAAYGSLSSVLAGNPRQGHLHGGHARKTIGSYRNCPEMRCGGCAQVSWSGAVSIGYVRARSCFRRRIESRLRFPVRFQTDYCSPLWSLWTWDSHMQIRKRETHTVHDLPDGPDRTRYRTG
jgi:hypothetical protein